MTCSISKIGEVMVFHEFGQLSSDDSEDSIPITGFHPDNGIQYVSLIPLCGMVTASTFVYPFSGDRRNTQESRTILACGSDDIVKSLKKRLEKQQ